MNPTNLTKYKQIKKLNRVVSDLTEIQKLFNLGLHGFSTYKKYVPVREVLSSLSDNKVIVDLALKKFKKSLESLNENELE